MVELRHFSCAAIAGTNYPGRSRNLDRHAAQASNREHLRENGMPSNWIGQDLLRIGKRSVYEFALTQYLITLSDEDRAIVLRFLRSFLPHGYVFTPTAEERFWPNVHITAECWEWTGAITCKAAGEYGTFGYGIFGLGGRRNNAPAHRVAYLWLRGPIPDGLDLDHLCRNRQCVNPWHLEPVTRGENVWRGVVARRPLYCPRGHSWADPANVIINGNCRTCRKCKNEHALEYYYKRERTRRISTKTHCKNGHSLSGDNVLLCKNGRRYCRSCRVGQLLNRKRGDHGRLI